MELCRSTGINNYVIVTLEAFAKFYHGLQKADCPPRELGRIQAAFEIKQIQYITCAPHTGLQNKGRPQAAYGSITQANGRFNYYLITVD